MISIIIVNYRSWSHLGPCLEALIAIDNLEIIVIDNNSADGEMASFSKKYQHVKFVDAGSNIGFGAACNLGVSHASHEMILFLNPDTIAHADAIFEMRDFLIQNSDFKIVSCQQHEKLSKHFLPFPNGFRMFGLLRAIFSKNKFKIHQKNKAQFIEPDWVSGSVIMTSKTWLNQIIGWSQPFWMYSEDLDICKKTANLKGKIALLTHVKIYHKHGGATRKNLAIAAMTKAEVIKSKHVYYQLHLGTFEKIWAHMVLIFNWLLLKLPLGILGLVFFFIPKLNLQSKILIELTKYYWHAIKNKTWLSEKLLAN
jgi:GT2 family glycosyltransferase